jgi:hypothetical protein
MHVKKETPNEEVEGQKKALCLGKIENCLLTNANVNIN